MAIGAIMWFLGCNAPAHFPTPVETVQTLARAVAAKNWRLARECFTEEMQRENAKAIGTPEFYQTDYWVGSVTAQNFLKPIPILSKPAEVKVLDLGPDTAAVEIVYPDRVDKDVRLQRLKLRRDAGGNWRIGELFGSVRGRGAARTE